MNETPTLFLDFDGPLHSAEIQAINRHGEFIPHPALFAGLPILDELLKPFPDLQILVSSDWRLVVDDDTLKQLLGPLSTRFSGVMEITVPSRADAIKEEARRRRLSKWLALDDHSTVAKVAKTDARFIVCDPIVGIASSDVQQELVRKIRALINTTQARG